MDESIDPHLVPRNDKNKTKRLIVRIQELKDKLISSDAKYDEHGRDIKGLLCQYIDELPVDMRETYSWDKISVEIAVAKEAIDKDKIKEIKDIYEILSKFNASHISVETLLVKLCEDYSSTHSDIEESIASILEEETFDFSDRIKTLPEKKGKTGKYPPDDTEYSIARTFYEDFATFMRENEDKKFIRIDMSNNRMHPNDPPFMYSNQGSPTMINMFELMCLMMERNYPSKYVYLDLRGNSISFEEAQDSLIRLTKGCPNLKIDFRGNEFREEELKKFEWAIIDW